MTRRGFKIFVFCLLSISSCLHAQFRQVSIGVNGLTCSQCSRSVEMQLRKLPFVKDIRMDLEHTEGRILFKENKPVNIKAIARAVKDAGFSVRYLKADIDGQDIKVSEEGCFNLYGDVYYVSKLNKPQEGSVLTLQFLGKEYLPQHELKRYKLPAALKCKGKTVYYTVLSRE